MESRAPKEQPPRKLSGKRTVVGGNSGKQMRRVRPYLNDDVSRRAADRLPVILSGPVTEGADAGFAGEWHPRLARLRRILEPNARRRSEDHAARRAAPRTQPPDGHVRPLRNTGPVPPTTK